MSDNPRTPGSRAADCQSDWPVLRTPQASCCEISGLNRRYPILRGRNDKLASSILKRLLPLAAAIVFATGRLTAAESLELDASENLFYVMAAINAAGYDDGINLPDNNPIRKQLRDFLAKQNIPVLPALRDFYRRQMRGNRSATEDLAPYLSWALSVTGAPDFRWKGRDIDVPPDAVRLAAFTPLMADFYQQANLKDLWQRAKPVYELELERYHAPLVDMTTRVDGYLRVPSNAYFGRHFRIFVELLAAPEHVQTRSYGDDIFVMVSPSQALRIFDIRHAYLHYQVDPIVIKYGMDLKQKGSLLDLVQTAPLEEGYKNDIVLLANESLIKAVEARIDKQPAGVDQAMRQGYVLTRFFSEQLLAFDKQQQGMRFYAQDMIQAIEMKREIARIGAVKFDSAVLQRAAKQVAVAGPEPTPMAKALEDADNLYGGRQLDEAKKRYLKILEMTGTAEENASGHAAAWYGLARIAILQNDPDAAVNLFQKTLGSSPDAPTRAWSYVYLARLARAAGEMDEARKFYKEALVVEGASAMAREAAEKELFAIPPQNQEI